MTTSNSLGNLAEMLAGFAAGATQTSSGEGGLLDRLRALRAAWNGFAPDLPIEHLIRSVFLLAAGWLLARLTSLFVGRMLATRPDGHRRIAQRAVFGGVLLLFGATALQQFGFELGVLFGAAGVLTVAIGFASQTSASNLISGLFLLSEQAIAVGDAIEVGTLSGEVLSIDLLSTKLRTFDNTLVRIPNETLIKTNVVVLTKFPIRRVDLELPLSAGADLGRVQVAVAELAARNPRVLDEPAPAFFVLGFTEQSTRVRFSVWVQQTHFVALRTALYVEIQHLLAAHGVGLALPRREYFAAPSDSKVNLTKPEPLIGDPT